ncbi:unnamed protein product, partial [Prorocentrum cordatum]
AENAPHRDVPIISDSGFPELIAWWRCTNMLSSPSTRNGSRRRRREPSNSCPWSCTTARASVIEGVRFRSKLYHSGLLVGAMIEKSRVPDSGRQRRAGEEVAGYCSLRTPSI